MFSDELAILDRNTEEYMVDEMKKEIEELKSQKDKALMEKDNEIMLLKEQLAQFQKSRS